MSNRSNTSVRQVWVARVDRFQQSHQSVAEFCQAEGVSQASLYQWRRKLNVANAAAPQPLPAFVPVKLRASEVAQPTTVMSVELPGGVRVRLEVTQAAQGQS